MALTAAKLRRLRSFLETLPEGLAARLAVLIEADKQAHAGTLPHDEILQALRPKLDKYRAHGALAPSEIGQLAFEKGLTLASDRRNLLQVIGALLEHAPHEIAKATPVVTLGSFSTTHLADFSNPVSNERTALALRYARLIAGCRSDPVVSGLTTLRASAENDVVRRLRSYWKHVLAELSAAEPSRRGVVEQRLAVAIELMSVLAGREEADALVAKAKAAVERVEP